MSFVRVFPALLALSVFIGCGKGHESGKTKPATGGEAAKPAGEGATAAAPELTKDSLLGTKDSVKTGDNFDEARAKLDKALGKSIYAEKTHQWWAVTDGDSCFGTTIEAADDGSVGAYMAPRELTATDGNKYEQCVAAANRNACHRRGEADCNSKYETAPFPEDEAMAGIHIEGCEPNTGPAAGGTEVTVKGTGLKAALDKGAKVLFGTHEVEAADASDESFKVETPAAKAGDYLDIVLVLPDGHREIIGSFAYL